VDAMFAEFVPLQLGCLSDYSELIPRTLEAIAEMRKRGMKIGSTSIADLVPCLDDIDARLARGERP
jgi:hypothetical protein